MNTNDYCRNVDKELSQWKEKLNHIVSQLDAIPTDRKQRMYEEVNSLHILMTEMDDRINRLRSECEIAWEPEFDEATPSIAGTSRQFKDAESVHFDYDFGG